MYFFFFNKELPENLSLEEKTKDNKKPNLVD